MKRLNDQIEIHADTQCRKIVVVIHRGPDRRLHRRVKTLPAKTAHATAFKTAVRMRHALVRELRARAAAPQRVPEPCPSVDELATWLADAKGAALSTMQAAVSDGDESGSGNWYRPGQVHLDVLVSGRSGLCRNLKTAAKRLEGVTFGRVWNKTGVYELQFTGLRTWTPDGLDIDVQYAALGAAAVVLEARAGALTSLRVWET